MTESNSLYFDFNTTVVPGDSIDVNFDGESDFFFSEETLCTADIPVSGCSVQFSVRPTPGRSILYSRHNSVAQPVMTQVGPAPDILQQSEADLLWSGFSATVGSVSFNMRDGTHFVSSSNFLNPNDRYLCFRLGDGDEPQYGWLRLKVTVTIDGVVATDFEGAIGLIGVGEFSEPVVAGVRP